MPGGSIGSGMGLGGNVMILIVLGVAALTVYLIMEASRTRATKEPRQAAPLDIIKERYARGEITRQEYEQLQNDLQ